MAKNKDLYPDEESKGDQKPNLREVIENIDTKEVKNQKGQESQLISKEVANIIKKTAFGLLPMYKKIKINDVEALQKTEDLLVG